MSLSVHEAMKLPIMQRTKLLRGQSGINKLIDWVTIVEVIEDETRLQENEFLITTGYGIQERIRSQPDFVTRLFSRNLSAVAIQIGFYLESIPLEFEEASERYEIPLIELPQEFNFSMVTRELLPQVVNQRIKLFEYSESIFHTLTDLVLKNQSLRSIVDVLQSWTEGYVLICDKHSNVLAHSGVPEWIVEASLHEIEDYIRNNNILHNILEGKKVFVRNLTLYSTIYHVTGSPLIAGEEILGFLLVVKEQKLEEMDLLAVGHASTMSALQLLTSKQIEESERRFKADILTELFSHTEGLTVHLQSHLTNLGLDLNQSHVVALLSTADGSWNNRLTRNIETLLQNLQIWHLLKDSTTELTILLQQKDVELLNMWLKTFGEKSNGPEIWVFVGNPYVTLTDLAKSATQAQITRRYGSAIHQDSNVICYESLSPYQPFIHMLEDGISLHQYFNSIIGPLIEVPYLLVTLEELLKRNMSRKETSANLFIHRHTLNYRIEKIEALTERRLENAQHRFELQMALVAYRLSP